MKPTAIAHSRVLLACFVLIAAPAAIRADISDDTLRFYLSKSELVVAGTVLNEPIGVTEAGVVDYVCEISIDDVLAGKLPENANKLKLSVVRFVGTGGVPQKNMKYLLFLKPLSPTKPLLVTSDLWFGIQKYNELMALSVERVAKQVAEEKRWKPFRQLKGDAAPDDLPKLFELADSDDVKVALKALSWLSNYQPRSDIARFLNRKMKDPNKELALEAAIVSCYSGDGSGFDMLLKHVDSKDVKLRRTAIGQLVDIQFHDHAHEIIPTLLNRLKVETDPAFIDRTLETLASYPSHQVLDAVAPFTRHENDDIRVRARRVFDRMKKELTAEKSR